MHIKTITTRKCIYEETKYWGNSIKREKNEKYFPHVCKILLGSVILRSLTLLSDGLDSLN